MSDNIPDFVYSIDDEEYLTLDEMQELLQSDYDAGDSVVVSKGIPRQLTHYDILKRSNIIDTLVQAAADDAGEYSDDYLSDVDSDVEEDILRAFAETLDKFADRPDFYEVAEVATETMIVG